MLREAVDVLQPLLAGGTLLEGNFRWMCASLVPLGGFRNMGRTERPLFACRPDMRQHMQQLQQHCLELWTGWLSTSGASHKDYFLAGYLPRRPGGGPPARPYKIGRARGQWLWPGRPRPPPAADVRPAPCRLCPIHVKPQCKQCRLARREVAHYCARGHKGHPMAVAWAAASSRVLQAWLVPPEPPPEPPAKRPCVVPAPAVASRRQRPDCRSPSPPARRSWVQSTQPWVGNAAPPPPHGIQRAPQQGGGGDRYGQRASVARDLWGREGSYTAPPPFPCCWHPGGSPALGGGARGRAPYERRFLREIARADGVLGTTQLTLPTFAPTGGRGGATGA